MKPINLIFVVAIIFSCASPKVGIVLKENNEEVQDSVKYEMIVLDQGFESWFAANSKPDWYHEQSYYEMWNNWYVQAWNAKIHSYPEGHLLSNPIEYNDQVDYGLEINHKLYYYFQFVEKELKIPILRYDNLKH